MKKFRLEFVGKTVTPAVEFILEDHPLATQWAQQVQSSKVIYTGSADTPTEVRVKFQWQALRNAIDIINDEHITDEWIHVPEDFPEGEWQAICNEIRLKGQIYEIYAGHHQLNTPTRRAFSTVASIINNLEYTVNSTGSVKGTWFKWTDTLEVPQELRVDEFKFGNIVAVQPVEFRTLSEARRANDTAVIQRNLLRQWSFTNRAFFAFSDFKENIEENNKWLAEKTLQEKVANYSSNYFILASMTTLLSDSDKQELLRSRLERIVFQ